MKTFSFILIALLLPLLIGIGTIVLGSLLLIPLLVTVGQGILIFEAIAIGFPLFLFCVGAVKIKATIKE